MSSERLDALARRLERDVAGGLIPGATVVMGRGGGVFERSVGFRDAAARDPLRPDAVWRMVSMTKPLVTAAAMVLVERGMLRLDQPVADLIPAFDGVRVAAPGGGTAGLRNGRATVTDTRRGGPTATVSPARIDARARERSGGRSSPWSRSQVGY